MSCQTPRDRGLSKVIPLTWMVVIGYVDVLCGKLPPSSLTLQEMFIQIPVFSSIKLTYVISILCVGCWLS